MRTRNHVRRGDALTAFCIAVVGIAVGLVAVKLLEAQSPRHVKADLERVQLDSETAFELRMPEYVDAALLQSLTPEQAKPFWNMQARAALPVTVFSPEEVQMAAGILAAYLSDPTWRAAFDRYYAFLVDVLHYDREDAFWEVRTTQARIALAHALALSSAGE